MNDYKLNGRVSLGANYAIGNYVIIGEMPKGEDNLETIIGENAIIRSHTVIYAGNVIGDNFQTGNHTNIREYNEIGNNVSIGTNSVIEFKVKIEDNVRIHSCAFIPEHCHLKKRAWIGPGVRLTNAHFPLAPEAKKYMAGVIVEEDAIIGAGAVILPGRVIGRGSLVGAGAVVTRDVLPYTVVVGNPARKIKMISDLTYANDVKAYFGENI